MGMGMDSLAGTNFNAATNAQAKTLLASAKTGNMTAMRNLAALAVTKPDEMSAKTFAAVKANLDEFDPHPMVNGFNPI